MKTLNTEGIILGRINFGEADRIITVLTPDHGKLRLMAKGVRKVKSKLAGGIELFSTSEISYISGKGDIGTLVSSRLKTHYRQIVSDMDRVQLGYEMIKLINKITEDSPEESYFNLLEQVFMALDDKDISLELIRVWFEAQAIKDAGHIPNLNTDSEGNKLNSDSSYNLDIDDMSLVLSPNGLYKPNQIKVLRLLFSPNVPGVLSRVQGIEDILPDILPLMNTMFQTHLG